MERITYERINETDKISELRNDKKDPLAFITQGLLLSKKYIESEGNSLCRLARELDERMKQSQRENGTTKEVWNERLRVDDSSTINERVSMVKTGVA